MLVGYLWYRSIHDKGDEDSRQSGHVKYLSEARRFEKAKQAYRVREGTARTEIMCRLKPKNQSVGPTLQKIISCTVQPARGSIHWRKRDSNLSSRTQNSSHGQPAAGPSALITKTNGRGPKGIPSVQDAVDALRRYPRQGCREVSERAVIEESGSSLRRRRSSDS